VTPGLRGRGIGARAVGRRGGPQAADLLLELLDLPRALLQLLLQLGIALLLARQGLLGRRGRLFRRKPLRRAGGGERMIGRLRLRTRRTAREQQ